MSLPPDARYSCVWSSLADLVREADGEWVPVKRNVWPNTAHRLRTGQVAAFRPADRFFVVSRRPENPEPGQHPAKVDVWVRLADPDEGGDA